MLLSHNPWSMTTEHTESTPKLSVAVAEEIRVWMTRRRMSGERLARELDVSPAWVSYRINGQVDIKLGELERIADVLQVPVADLLPTPVRRGTGEELRPSSAAVAGQPRSAHLIAVQHPHEHPTPASPYQPTDIDQPVADYPAAKMDIRRSIRPVRLCGGTAR
jgi:transcriptional regulator with XRE-family HTH domain